MFCDQNGPTLFLAYLIQWRISKSSFSKGKYLIIWYQERSIRNWDYQIKVGNITDKQYWCYRNMWLVSSNGLILPAIDLWIFQYKSSYWSSNEIIWYFSYGNQICDIFVELLDHVGPRLILIYILGLYGYSDWLCLRILFVDRICS